MKRNPMLIALFALFSALVLGLAACGGDDEPSSDAGGAAGEAPEITEPVTISYWLWDENQLPLYEKCATGFQADNPNITVDIQQFGWGDYWDQLTAGFATGDVPDVFTDHLARYPEFVNSDVLLPLNDFVERDGVDTGAYFPGLAELWVNPEGQRYGLPKDWDTVAIVADKARLADAGVTAEDFAAATWNPEDGGTFQEIIAKLSVDKNGNRGDSADFDPGNVEQYGWVGQTVGDAYGQVWFSSLAASTGFEYLDSNPFGSEYFFDDERFTGTIGWIRSMIEKGYIPPMDIAGATGPDTLFTEGQVAAITDGSWKIGTWSDTEGIDPVFIPNPIGPEGRASMFNGLADSITTASENPEASWQWVKYLASPACQDVVGEGAVVFPALTGATDIAKAAHADAGRDVSAFTVHVEEESTFLFPIAGNASEVNRIMGGKIDEVLRGDAEPADIAGANDEVNATLTSG